MKPLIEQLFDPDKIVHIKSLWKDRENRLLLQEVIADKMVESNDLLELKALDYFVLLTSRARFSDSAEESVTVAGMLNHCLKIPDILPLVTVHKHFEFSSRCLVSLALFRRSMEYRYNKFAAPSCEYYRGVSKIFLLRDHFESLAAHHEAWESYLVEHLV